MLASNRWHCSNSAANSGTTPSMPVDTGSTRHQPPTSTLLRQPVHLHCCVLQQGCHIITPAGLKCHGNFVTIGEHESAFAVRVVRVVRRRGAKMAPRWQRACPRALPNCVTGGVRWLVLVLALAVASTVASPVLDSARSAREARTAAATMVEQAAQQLATTRDTGAGACSCAVVRLQQSPRCAVDGCSGHGACQDGGCVCQEAWTGDDCSVSVATAPSTPRPPESLLTVVFAHTAASKQDSALAPCTDQGWTTLPAAFSTVPVAHTAVAGEGDEANSHTWAAALTEVKVSTPYALVLSPGMTVSAGVTPAGIVSAMQASGLVVAGGMVEERLQPPSQTGPARWHLSPSCHIIRAKNYTFDSTPGWVSHRGGCQVCDLTSASFAMDVRRFRRQLRLDPTLDSPGLALADMAIIAKTQALAQAQARVGRVIGACPSRIQFRRVPGCPRTTAASAMAGELGKQVSLKHLLSQWNFPDGSRWGRLHAVWWLCVWWWCGVVVGSGVVHAKAQLLTWCCAVIGCMAQHNTTQHNTGWPGVASVPKRANTTARLGCVRSNACDRSSMRCWMRSTAWAATML